MDKTLIFGHKNPDTDSILSALILENLENHWGIYSTKACRLGKINKETEYALNYFKVETPELIESVEPGQKVILVDHNEFCQSAPGIENAKIEKVIDHHRIADFQTADPLFFMAQPVGCTATILYEIYKMNNVEISPTIAGLMLSAIISDTLLLKSPTTTIKETRLVDELAKIAGVDYKIYGLEMLKAGTDLSDYSAEELINIDAKCVDMNDNKVKIAQVNTVDIEDVLKNQTDIEAAISDTISKENLDLFMFAITDIVNSNSEALVLGKRTDIVEKAYNVKLENNRAFLPGVVSRKKQMLPIMQENA